MTTKSQVIATDVAALLRARNPLLWVVTRDEARVERYLIEAAAAAGYVPRTWDVAAGVADISGKIINANSQDPDTALREIGQRAVSTGAVERSVWIMRDLHAWVVGPPGATVLRNLRNLSRLLPSVPREKAQAVGHGVHSHDNGVTWHGHKG